MEIKKVPARLAALLAALAVAGSAPAGAAADGFGFVTDAGTSIDYQGDPGQDALLTLDVVTTDNGVEQAVVTAINNIDASEQSCKETAINRVECNPARERWTVLSFELNDVIDNVSLKGLTATLGAGNDAVTSRDGADHLFGQAGNDTLTAGGGADEVDGDDGNDVLRGGPGADVVRGGAGADDMDGGDGDDFMVGATEDDHLTGGAGDDTLSAGPGDDLIEGGEGGDAIGGNEGNDRLVGGPGADSLSGGEGLDRADYSERSVPLRISLDDVDNDGEAGEGDNVGADVEDVVGGAENDRIVGSNGDNAISGGGGHDLLIGNGGTDVLTGGDGDDIIQSRDGIPETLACGAGTDTAIMDEFDTPQDCENIQATREFQPDVDADGVLAPADCDDHNPAIKPGATDTPHNGIDEDCSGADAFLPAARGTLVHAFQTRGRNTRVVRLAVVRAPVGAKVKIACTGRRCPFTARTIRVRRVGSRVDLTRLFRRRVQAAGGTVEVRVLEASRQTRITRFRFRNRRAPSISRSCLAPGATRPGACP